MNFVSIFERCEIETLENAKNRMKGGSFPKMGETE